MVEKMLARLDQMISQGTLTIEAKSGYGLEVILLRFASPAVAAC